MFFFKFAFTVITILPKKGQNPDNTTIFHIRVTMYQTVADHDIRRKRFFHTIVLEPSKLSVTPIIQFSKIYF